MKRSLILLLSLCFLLSFASCAAAEPAEESVTPEPEAEAEELIPEVAETEAVAPAETPVPAEEPATVSAVPDISAVYSVDMNTDWAGLYRQFLDDNFDVLAALWPDGMSGVGYIDLDLDGMPELVLFDMGASAALGVQLFDIVDGQVVCVSSMNEAAAAAFGDEYFSPIALSASAFEDFRLVYDGEKFWFALRSANGSVDYDWTELARFGCGENGVLTLTSLCRCETETDAETGTTLNQSYTVRGETATAEAWEAAEADYAAAVDFGYEAAGVFLWEDEEHYDPSLEGLLVMADAAAAAYQPVV